MLIFAEQVWGEIWEFIEIPLQNCLKGIPTAQDNQLLFWDRLKEGPNKMEEVYATWYYVPYFSQDRVIGNLHMLFEQQNKQVRHSLFAPDSRLTILHTSESNQSPPHYRNFRPFGPLV